MAAAAAANAGSHGASPPAPVHAERAAVMCLPGVPPFSELERELERMERAWNLREEERRCVRPMAPIPPLPRHPHSLHA